MLAWLLYAVLVSFLAGLAAAAAERGLRLYELPARGAWAVAMLVSAGLPLLAWLTGGLPAGVPTLPAIGVGEAVARIGETVGAGGGRMPSFPSLDAVLPWAWAAATGGALAWLGLSALRLRRSLDGLPTRTVGGVTVHLTGEEGPACWGVPGRTARVLLPAWLRELAPDLRRLALAHEREHLRRGDSLLAAGGLLVVAAAPWNLPLWWQLRRLRRAVELDCDGRVLEAGADPRAYGRLLLAVGGRACGSARTALPLSENASRLRGRIRSLVAEPAENRTLRAAAFALLALAAGALACETSPPEPNAAADASRQGTAGDRPTFVPYDEAPELQNPEEVQARLQDLYPDSLERAGVGGTVTLRMYVDTDGNVEESEIRESSGHGALDRAAREVVGVMEFSPALNRDQPRAVWVRQEIRFQPDSAPPGEDQARETP